MIGLKNMKNMNFATSKILAVGKSLLLFALHDLQTYFSVKVLFLQPRGTYLDLKKGFRCTEPETEVGCVGSTEVEYLCPQDGPHTTRLCETKQKCYFRKLLLEM